MQLDHIIPLILDGDSNIKNTELVEDIINNLKDDNTKREFLVRCKLNWTDYKNGKLKLNKQNQIYIEVWQYQLDNNFPAGYDLKDIQIGDWR